MNSEKQPALTDLLDSRRQGLPVFSESDVLATPHVLDRILRRVFVDHQISVHYFKEEYHRYALQFTNPDDVRRARSGFDNMLKALRVGNITMKRFLIALIGVLRYRLEDLQISLRIDNDRTEVSLSEVIKRGRLHRATYPADQK